MSLGTIATLDYTVLLCRTLADTRAFYRDVLGLPIETDTGTWVDFRLGAARLTLRPRGSGSLGNDGPLPPGSAAVQLAFRVPSPAAVDRCGAELLAAGIPILRGPLDLPRWGHRALFFRDPEDNLLELYADLTAPTPAP